MEGMWSRFFPAEQALRLLLQRGVIGEPLQADARFTFAGSKVRLSPRVMHPACSRPVQSRHLRAQLLAFAMWTVLRRLGCPEHQHTLDDRQRNWVWGTGSCFGSVQDSDLTLPNARQPHSDAVCTVQETRRLFDPKLGGGGLLDIGIYPVALMSWIFGQASPADITALAVMHPEGADASGSAQLRCWRTEVIVGGSHSITAKKSQWNQ